jgi:hypothetical protein
MQRAATLAGAGAVLVLLATGCRDQRVASREHGSEDTAGAPPASVATLTATQWSTELPWRIVEDLTIGREDGPPEYVLSGVVALAIGKQGDIYALLRPEHMVRVYSADGRFQRVIGSSGEGPGQFRDPAGMTLFGDSVLIVFDRILRRLTEFGLDGGLRRTVPIMVTPVADGLVTAIKQLDERGLLFGVYGGYSTPPKPGRDGRTWLLRVDLEGTVADTVLAFDGPDLIVVPGPRYPLVIPAPFGHAPFWDVARDGRIAYGRSDKDEIVEYDPSGVPIRRLLGRPPRLEVTSRDAKQYLAAFPWGDGVSDLAPDVRSAVERVRGDLRIPDLWPALDGIRYDVRGRLWVKRPARRDDATARWDVYGEARDLLGSVSLPASLRVHVITESAVYGVVTTDAGVPRIRRYRIVRP